MDRVDETRTRGCIFGKDFAHIRLHFADTKSRSLSKCLVLIFSRENQFKAVSEVPGLIDFLNSKRVPIEIATFENLLLTTSGYRRFSTYLESQVKNSMMTLWSKCRDLFQSKQSADRKTLSDFIVRYFLLPPPEVSQVQIPEALRKKCLDAYESKVYDEDTLFELMQYCLYEMFKGPWIHAASVMASDISIDEQRRARDPKFREESDAKWGENVKRWRTEREARQVRWESSKSQPQEDSKSPKTSAPPPVGKLPAPTPPLKPQRTPTPNVAPRPAGGPPLPGRVPRR
eukprot:TRINITY_DN18827_c0_g4_i1.p1 TRINITY_DN18827_c0_g4~~TRINITY_DN18827_c0_g4_i1.p1  ORF type:complete len:337 (-),score=63.14 TRINITY_DN18827_c0_g4_i1:126-986(-)